MVASSRTHALTFAGPLAARRLWWCRAKLPVLGMLAPSTALGRLRFIHFGGWIVCKRLPGSWQGPDRPRPAMIFLSDYDGDPDEYLAAFGIGIEAGMRWSFGSYEGFPGPRPTPPFVDYVNGGRSEELLRYSAYPDATVRDVDTALAVVEELDQLRAAVTRTEDEPGDEQSLEVVYASLQRTLMTPPEPTVPSWWRGIWQALRHKPTVTGLVVALPIAADRRADAEVMVRLLGIQQSSLLSGVTGLHFARAAVIEAPVRRRSWRSWRPWRRRRPDRTEPAVPYLLFSAWVDGSVEKAVDQLVKVLVTPTRAGTPADDLWGSCTGYPGADDPERLVRWVLAHRLDFSFFVDSRAGVTVEQIQAAVRLRNEVMATVEAHEGRSAGEACRALARLPA